MRNFEGKTAVVTGAASGMGLAFAERFAAEGMNVVMADIEEEALAAEVRRLEQAERNVIGAVVDTRSRGSVDALRDRANEAYGNVHLLFNNAGVASRTDAGLGRGERSLAVWEMPDETWEWVMGVNFWGVLYGIQSFVPHMIEHGEPGHIVNTASLAALIPGASAYSVSKHGVLTLTEGLYFHLRDRGTKIGASVLCPGFVNTKIALAGRNRPDDLGGPEEATEEQLAGASVALGGGMAPSDVAEQVYEAVVEERAYILPHPGWDEVIRGRIEAVLDRRAPYAVDFEALLQKRAEGELV